MQPYSIQSDVTNQTLLVLAQQAAWNVTPGAPSDIEVRIQEADSEIDSRLASMGYSIPFSNNPPLLKTLSVLYSRYACFRDLFAAGSPSGGGEATKAFESAFEKRMSALQSGNAFLVDASGNIVSNSKYGVSFTSNRTVLDQPGGIISSYISDFDAVDLASTPTTASSVGVTSALAWSDGLYNDIVATNPTGRGFRWATDVKQLLYYTGDSAQGANGWIVDA